MSIKNLLDGKYDIYSFSYTNDFIVVLKSNEKVLNLNFGDRIVKLNFYEEELPEFNDLLNSYKSELRNEIGNISLIEIIDSPALNKLSNDTNDFYSESELNHYCIIAMNHIMEVITFDEVHIY